MSEVGLLDLIHFPCADAVYVSLVDEWCWANMVGFCFLQSTCLATLLILFSCLWECYFKSNSKFSLQSSVRILQHFATCRCCSRGGTSTTFLCLDAFHIEKKQVSRQLGRLYSLEGYTHHRSPHMAIHFVTSSNETINFAAEYSK